MGIDDGRPGRRRVITASALGLTSLTLPTAVDAASDASAAAVSAWSDTATLSFSDATTTGFTVSWDPAA